MPTKRKYQSIKNNPIRYEKFKKSRRDWMRARRAKRIFDTVSKRFKYGCARCQEKNVSAWDLWKIAKKQKLICPLSGRKLTRLTLSIDHRIPLAKGGTTTVDNLQWVHKDINIAKSTLSENEFIKLCKDVSSFHL